MKALKKRNGSKETRLSFLSVKALIVFAVLLILIVFVALKNTRPQHQLTPVRIPQPVVLNIPFTHDEAQQMLLALFAEMEPDKPENSYVPSFARGKLRQVIKESNKGLLILRPEESKLVFPDGDNNLTLSAYDQDKPMIQLGIQRLVNLAMADFKAGRAFSRSLKNNMYYGVSHERLHLDQSPEVFLHTQTSEQHIKEEMRVWAICDREIVESFILRGEPIDTSLLTANQVLKSCKDGWENCLVFRKWIQQRI